MPELERIVIVDNGGDVSDGLVMWTDHSAVQIAVAHQQKNLGWCESLKRGLKLTNSEFVLFLNDDVEFERMSDGLTLLLSHFDDPTVAMVGPATGTAMGLQAQPGPPIEDTNLLVGFCSLVRVSALKKIGGLDTRFNNGGDDIDLCIRFKDRGYRMVIDRRVFVYHHGYKTGNRIFGGASVPGGWNSKERTLEIYGSIVEKHGREKLLRTLALPPERGGMALEHGHIPPTK